MSPRVGFLLLLAVLTQICVGTEFTAFCDLAHVVYPDAKCPETCTDREISVQSVVGTCSATNHILTVKASNVGLTSVPDSLNEMTSLQVLNLANNKLEKLPTLTALTALKTLYLYDNKLTSITGVFPVTNTLESIMISGNALTELPPELANMASLRTLNVKSNELSSLPEEYKTITTIKTLDISENRFDCSQIKKDFPGTVFADECIQTQQKTEDSGVPLPLVYEGEPPNAGLDGYEIASIILFVLFVILLVVFIVLYKRFRGNGPSQAA